MVQLFANTLIHVSVLFVYSNYIYTGCNEIDLNVSVIRFNI